MNRIFIPAPHFPPSSMPPSQRVRLLIRHLHEFGWQPVIFTVDHYYREELADPWMIEITGDKYEKIEVSCFDQRKSRKFGIGDLGLRMFFGLYRSLKKESKKRKPDLILYPVPPWYIMIMAPFIKRISGVPYAIDFIDPWVHHTSKKGFKAKMSQWLARRCEGFAVKRSAAVFAVSQGILDALIDRYPSIKHKPLVAVPYGVEMTDFSAVKAIPKTGNEIILRYTGAISEAMMPVVETLIKALVIVKEKLNIKVEFTGTSYAGTGMVKAVLRELINKNNAASFIIENPARVGYREALELGMQADLQLLIGDTTPYYAASKLMGLVASGKPFYAIVHCQSFPAVFLKETEFENIYEFEIEELNTYDSVLKIAKAMITAIEKRESFKPIPVDNPVLQQHTAYAMTKIFSDTLKKIINE